MVGGWLSLAVQREERAYQYALCWYKLSTRISGANIDKSMERNHRSRSKGLGREQTAVERGHRKSQNHLGHPLKINVTCI